MEVSSADETNLRANEKNMASETESWSEAEKEHHNDTEDSNNEGERNNSERWNKEGSTKSELGKKSDNFARFEEGFTEDALNLLQASMMSNDSVDYETDDEDKEDEVEVLCTVGSALMKRVDENTIANVNESLEYENNDSHQSSVNHNDTTTNLIEEHFPKMKRIRNTSPEHVNAVPKKKKKAFQPPKLKSDNRDIFCWRCHKYGEDLISCKICPRVYHLKCSHLQEKPSIEWICTECEAVAEAEKLTRR